MGHDREELAWAAGFFDGEGSSMLANHGQSPRHRSDLRLSIGQSHGTELLDRFRAAVGGLGTVHGPYHSTRISAVPHWSWQAHGFQRSQAIIVMLWPWLSSPKKEQYTSAVKRWREYQTLNPYKHNYPKSLWRRTDA